MRHWLPIMLLLAVAILFGIGRLWPSRPDAPIAPGAAELLPPPPSASASLEDSAAETQRAALTQPAPASGTSASSVPSNAQLNVRVIGKTSRAPVAKVRLMLGPASEKFSDAGKSAHDPRGDLGTHPITGSDGIVVFDLPPGLDCTIRALSEDERFRPRGSITSGSNSGRYTAQFSFEEYLAIETAGQPARAGQTSVLVPALLAGEQRELVLEFEDGLDGRVVGKVVCAETGESVSGARVRFLQGDQTRREYKAPGPDCVTTGNDGAFELAFALRAHPLLCVEAEGYGLRYANLDGGHSDLAHALVVHVSRAATLNARVLDAAGAPIEGAWVELSVTGFMLLSSVADERGYFPGVQQMSFPPDEQWRAETGADGRARIDGLPALVELGAEVTTAGKTLVHEPSGLRLQPGESREIEWRVGGGATVNGLLLDQDGKPLAGLEIWAAKKRSARSAQFLSFERDHVDLRTQTDSEGHFTLRELAAGNWWIGPGAGSDSPVAPTAEALELADGAVRELTLRVYRGLFIRGRVLTATGEPAQRSRVTGEGKPGEYFEGSSVTSDGGYRFGPLTPGSYSLYAYGFEKYSSSEPVSATAGDSNVVLQLKLGGRIRGRVIDSASGAACVAQLVFMPERFVPRQFPNGMMTSTQPDGTFDSSGFEPGRWSVTATTADGRFAQHAHLEVGADSDTGELAFALNPGGMLQISYRGVQAQISVALLCNGAGISFPEWIKSGASIQQLAPAGSLLLQIRSGKDGPVRTRTVELGPGETKEVVLTDED